MRRKRIFFPFLVEMRFLKPHLVILLCSLGRGKKRCTAFLTCCNSADTPKGWSSWPDCADRPLYITLRHLPAAPTKLVKVDMTLLSSHGRNAKSGEEPESPIYRQPPEKKPGMYGGKVGRTFGPSAPTRGELVILTLRCRPWSQREEKALVRGG